MKWMFTIPAVLAAMAVATAWATPPTVERPTEEAVQTITDLRAEVGPATGSGPEFAEALRAQFAQAFQNPPAQAWTGDRPPAPPAPPTPVPGWNGPRDIYAPVPAHPYEYDPNPPRSADRAGFNQPPPPPPPGPPHDRPRDPKTLLRRSAMEIDRLANELEMTELYAEADALREAAGKLRKAARTQADRSALKPGEPTAAAGPSMEHLRARVKNAMADANRRQAELQAKLAEAEAKLAEVTVDEQVRRDEAVTRPMNERELRRYLEDGQRRQREGRGRRGPPTQEDGRTPPHLPPPGVHGGPTEPGPAPADAQPYPG